MMSQSTQCSPVGCTRAPAPASAPSAGAPRLSARNTVHAPAPELHPPTPRLFRRVFTPARLAAPVAEPQLPPTVAMFVLKGRTTP